MALLGAWIKVVRAEVLIEGPVLEHVIDGRKYRCRDGQDRLLRATPRADAVKLSLEIGAFRSCRRPGALHQGGLEPRRALANPRRTTLACTLVAARADACPGDQVTAGRVTKNHRFLLRLHLRQIDAIDAAIAEIDREVEASGARRTSPIGIGRLVA